MANIQQKVAERVERYRQERQHFINLIREQEAIAAQHPEEYRNKVVRFAWLGYLYIFGVLVLLVLFLAALVYGLIVAGVSVIVGKLAIVVVPVIYFVLKSLFVKIDKPSGPRVSRTDAPKLWEDVDQLAKSMGAPKIGEIVLEMDMNAAAAQVPRLGIFGMYQNYLLLGLPLMLMLPPDEMKSVIAHEFGHFSGQHGRVGGWIYRLNTTFERIRQSLDSGSGNLLFGKFFAWYQPRFDAISFALRRQNEYAADAAASKSVGGKAAGQALMRLSYLDNLMTEGVWNNITERSKVEPDAPRDAYSHIGARLPEGLKSLDVADLLKSALSAKTDYEDTHPSLADRLRAMGELPEGDLDSYAEEFKRPIQGSAAEHYLGSSLPKFIEEFNREFQKQWKEGWREIHSEHVAEMKALEDLRAKREREPLGWQEKVDLAFLTLRKVEASQALPLFREMHGDAPNDPEVLFGLGEALLAVEDPEGEAYLRQSFSNRVEYLSSATQLIAAFHAKQGRMHAIDDLREEYLERAHAAQVIHEEQINLRTSDEFEQSAMDATERERLRQYLATRNDVKRAWLAAKVIPAQVRQLSDVLVLETKKTLLSSTDHHHRVTQDVLAGYTFPTPIVVYAPENAKPWSKRMAAVPDSLLFELGP